MIKLLKKVMNWYFKKVKKIKIINNIKKGDVESKSSNR